MKLFLSKIRISVVNGDPARFISFLKERDIIFSHIQLRDGALCGDLFPKDLPLAREAARQLGMELSVIQRQGPFYLVAPYRKRIGLIVGGILAALLLLFLQNFVWEITVPEGHNISTEVILRVLEE